ncbi:hypothetical protein C5167_034062 [Papaver somniferum]|uniref:Uncharacterized protein n=1 Tax=Papaver somniferum TaxID=3469 RepID=A0A4Y7KDI4_PAPSO|nr:hypothetical protein C5167_034062 [Papaver somniferum]
MDTTRTMMVAPGGEALGVVVGVFQHMTNCPPAAVAHPTVHSFTPSNPPPLKECRSIIRQLWVLSYILVANTPYQTLQPSFGPLGGGPSQMGSTSGHTVSQGPAPIPAQRPFMPGGNNTAGFSQRPAMGASMQAPSPAQPSQTVAAPAPATPPPTVQSVDTSKFPGRATCLLNILDISKNASDKLIQLCLALDNGDFVRGLKCPSSYCGKLAGVISVSGYTIYKYRLKRLEGEPVLTTNQVECPKYPGFCVTRQRKDYPYIGIFHSSEQEESFVPS